MSNSSGLPSMLDELVSMSGRSEEIFTEFVKFGRN